MANLAETAAQDRAWSEGYAVGYRKAKRLWWIVGLFCGLFASALYNIAVAYALSRV